MMTATMHSVRLFVLFFLTSFAGSALCEVTLPAVLAEHMVVQRNEPVHIWGNAKPGEYVLVRFRGAAARTTADELGRWQVTLPAGDAGGPFAMDVEATNAIHFSDVMVGDVWVASGQSNMEFPLRNAANGAKDIQNASHPAIRLFQVEKNSSPYALDDLRAKTWAASSPGAVPDFSAVAYFFALEIEIDQKVPVGIIESDWGGTPAESWTSERALGADASLMPIFARWAKETDAQAKDLLRYAKEQQETDAATAAGQPAPHFAWHAELRMLEPGGLYNAMIAPLTPFPIKGVIWYQGESNTDADSAPYYANLFQTMIRDWRQRWAEGDFPFLYVQIANWNAGADSMWPTVREAQRQTLMLKKTGMAVTIDIGDANNIHPTNKQDVGKRLALAARAIAYGEAVEYSGPLYQQAVQEGHSLRVMFDHAGGLMAKGGAPMGFEVAGSDGKYAPAYAKIDGASVVASSDTVATPVAVRYGWAANPQCNLYNGAGLPASPFAGEARPQ